MTSMDGYRFYQLEVGTAEPLYCGTCGSAFHCEQNLRKHYRQCHQRRRVP